MAGPTTLQVIKTKRAQDVVAINGAAGLLASGISVIIDSDNMNRGEVHRALTEAQEVILEGKWPIFSPGPTAIRVSKNARAFESQILNVAANALPSGMSVIIDSDNVSRGDACRAIEEIQEVVLEGKWPLF